MESIMNSEQPKQQRTVVVDGELRVVPDLSHHLSDLAKRRLPSPLKQLAKYMGKPGIIALAGGMPSPEYFPFDTLSAKVLPHDAFEAVSSSITTTESSFEWFWRLLGIGSKPDHRTEDIAVPKYAPSMTDNQLAVCLQYGMATGIAPLTKFLQEFIFKVHKPYLTTTTTVISTGNTDMWNRFVEAFCNEGDGLLVEEWSYPSALFTARPHGVKPVPVAMDLEGMRADALETVLTTWDEAARGMKRPHVMYLVPIGQNPSGATMGAERKKAIYDICVKYDVIICEDDPYYFLQEGPYTPPSYRARDTSIPTASEWIDSLSPSFLRFDYEGRVVRLDTFSKTVAPGSRLGWGTSSPLFTDALLRVGEVSTQAPCGFGQSMVTELLANHWGFDKYVRWLQGLQKLYTDRRDLMIDCIASEFDIYEEETDSSFFGGAKVLAAKEKRSKWSPPTFFDEKADKTWFSFIPPTSGMFVWVRVHLKNHPEYGRSDGPEPPLPLEQRLFYQIAENGLLIGPGWMFTTKLEDEIYLDDEPMFEGDSVVNGLLRRKVEDPSGNPSDHDPSQYAHFRIAFSMASVDDMRKAMAILSKTMREFFKL